MEAFYFKKLSSLLEAFTESHFLFSTVSVIFDEVADDCHFLGAQFELDA